VGIILGSLMMVGIAVGIGVGAVVTERGGDFRTREATKLAINRTIMVQVSIKRRVKRRSFLDTGLRVTSKGLFKGWSIF